ncbi:MAG: fimbrillin family protein [Bacteroidales bacterium]|nr:fimbrillin family protein [Bacteroidales bacterium]
MKKLMILAVAAIALVACSKEFDTNKSASNSAAIGFNTWAEQLTKARDAGSSTFVSGDYFLVSGFKTKSTTYTEVFANDTVKFNGSVWSYDNPRYWDSGADSYTFYAVSSPNTALAFTGAANSNSRTITATAVTFSGSNNDILLANSVDVLPANYKTDVPVAFNFKHIGALVDLKVKKTSALDDATVEITAIALEGVYDEANLAVTEYTDNVPTVAWTSLANAVAPLTYTNASGVTPVDLPDDVSSATADDLITSLIVIPQTLTTSQQILKISYTITDGAGNINTFTDKTVDLNLFDDTDYPTDDDDETDGNQYNDGDPISSWAAGTHYIYTLTIDANTINFTASITDWTTPATNGYYYLVN